MQDEKARPSEPARPAAQNLQAAALRVATTALKRILTADSGQDEDASRGSQDQGQGLVRTAQRKSHFCILLKPQIALHSEEEEDAVVYVAAMEASLKSVTILDLDHVDDPINGYIMRR